MRQLATEGVYYVTQDMTVRIHGGLLGVPLGTRVTMIADRGDRMLVTDGRDEFEINKAQVTNDPRLSALMIKRAQTVQAQQDQLRAQQNALLLKQQQEEIDFLRTHPLATPTPTPRK